MTAASKLEVSVTAGLATIGGLIHVLTLKGVDQNESRAYLNGMLVGVVKVMVEIWGDKKVVAEFLYRQADQLTAPGDDKGI